MEHDLITLTEGALMYGKSRTSFVWLIATDRIPHTEIGKRIFVKKSDVEKLIANRDVEGRVHNKRIEAVKEAA